MACHIRRLCQGAIIASAIPRSVFVSSFAPDFHQAVRSRVRSTNSPWPSVHPNLPLHSTPALQMSSSTSEGEKAYIDKLALILINSKQEQLVARSYGKQVFYTPGGKRESGESDTDALIRECKEELSVDITKFGSLQKYGIFEAQAFGKPEGVMVRMTCYRVQPRDAEIGLSQLVKANEEVEELGWISSSYDKEKLTVTGIMILDDLKEKGLIV